MKPGDTMIFNGGLVRTTEMDVPFYGRPHVAFKFLWRDGMFAPVQNGLALPEKFRPLTWFDRLWWRKELRLIRDVDKIVEACVEASNEMKGVAG